MHLIVFSPIGFDKIDAKHVHSYSEEIIKESTCTEDGVKTFTCVCGDSYENESPAIGHDYDSDGYCNNCDSHMHVWNSSYTIDKAATCTVNGSKSIHCKTCNEVKDEVVIKAEHTWRKTYTIDKAATCTTVGSESIHCSKCLATTDTKVILALGHDYVGSTCSRCQHVITGGGLYDSSGKRLCTWAESGIDVQIAHTQNSSTAANSPYVALKQNYKTAVKVVIPEGITKIGDFAFSGCNNLTYIEIPASVKSIGYRAFANCGAFEAKFVSTTDWYVGSSVGAKTTKVSLSGDLSMNASYLNDASKYLNKYWTKE